MPLLEDPARLSKSRLKSDLLAHNMALPPANSRKEVYVELHLKHIEQRNAAEFSSDEEDQAQDEPKGIFDLASTRAVYEKKLRRLLQPGAGDEQANGEEENAVLYSDSEDEDESEGDEEETVEQSQQEMSQESDFVYPQCFVLSSKLIKVFLVVVVLLYLIYVAVEESSLESVMSLLESPNQASDMEFYAQETMAVSEQE
ncbi:unnamed protein product [Tetraodon nigroviridis]|uniref:(spotted green pufferfish) hypothetical protein n=1 Tax=Tetraodon nigroviridis TaxID=99883 RepID=Q4S5S9_TETNG|nr:unnamed protein product [Tetraodon nigroviridis]